MEKEVKILSVWSFAELYESSWSGAKQTLQAIEEKGKEQEFLDLINEIISTYENGIDETTLNDFIWFDTDYIEESLDIKLWEE